MNKSELEIWKRLYDTASEISDMQPWESLGDTDLFCMELEKFPYPVYFNFLGKTGGRKGIVVYANPVGVYGFAKMLGGYPIPNEQLPRYQDSLTMFVRGNDKLTNRDISILNQLEQDSDSENCLYFRRYEYRYCPSVPNAEEAERFAEMLDGLKYMLNVYFENDIEIDFSSHMLKLSRNEQSGDLTLNSVQGKLPLDSSRTLHITNKLLMNKLEKRPAAEAKLELDLCFLKPTIHDIKFKKPFYARVLLMTDVDKSSVILNEPVHPEEDEYGMLITALVRYVEEAGKPQVIFVRDGYIKRALSDTCAKLNIMLVVSPKLPSIDKLVEKMNTDLTSTKK